MVPGGDQIHRPPPRKARQWMTTVSPPVVTDTLPCVRVLEGSQAERGLRQHPGGVPLLWGTPTGRFHLASLDEPLASSRNRWMVAAWRVWYIADEPKKAVHCVSCRAQSADGRSAYWVVACPRTVCVSEPCCRWKGAVSCKKQTAMPAPATAHTQKNLT